MANGYGSSYTTTATTTTSSLNQAAPVNIQTGSEKVITGFDLDLSNLNVNGEKRSFTISGDNGAVFTLQILNEDGHYYNFSTGAFAAAVNGLLNKTINGNYTGVISFPKVGDDDHYDIFLTAGENTRHADYIEARFADNTIDLNSSIGSDSALLRKKILQYTDITITLSAVSPNQLTAWGSISVTTDTFVGGRYSSLGTQSFTVVVTAAAARAAKIDRQPTPNDLMAWVARTMGAPLAIVEEDISGSTYYRGNVDNIYGLKNGMVPLGTNVTAGSYIGPYYTTVTTPTEDGGTEEVKTVEVPTIDPAGNTPTVTGGVVTAQAGTVTFNQPQEAALEDDAIRFAAHGSSNIESIYNGLKVSVSNLKAELTAVTTTTTSAVSNSATIPVAETAGIYPNFTTMGGIGVAEGSADPSITARSATSGAGNLTASAAQTLESGQTVNLNGASRVITITGDITFESIGNASTTIYFDLERFTSVV